MIKSSRLIGSIRQFLWCLVKSFEHKKVLFTNNHYSRILLLLICLFQFVFFKQYIQLFMYISFSELELKKSRERQNWKEMKKTLKNKLRKHIFGLSLKKDIWNYKFTKVLSNLCKGFTLRYQWAPIAVEI